jgi:hypothetical protein
VEDALADGYDDIDSLLEDIYQIYPKLEPNKYVTIIKFHTLTTPKPKSLQLALANSADDLSAFSS